MHINHKKVAETEKNFTLAQIETLKNNPFGSKSGAKRVKVSDPIENIELAVQRKLNITVTAELFHKSLRK